MVVGLGVPGLIGMWLAGIDDATWAEWEMGGLIVGLAWFLSFFVLLICAALAWIIAPDPSGGRILVGSILWVVLLLALMAAIDRAGSVLVPAGIIALIVVARKSIVDEAPVEPAAQET
jgi:hypothetical protein